MIFALWQSEPDPSLVYFPGLWWAFIFLYPYPPPTSALT